MHAKKSQKIPQSLCNKIKQQECKVTILPSPRPSLTSSSSPTAVPPSHLLLAQNGKIGYIRLHRLAHLPIQIRKSNNIIDLDHTSTSRVLEDAEYVLHSGVDVLRRCGDQLAVFPEVGRPGEDVAERDGTRVDGDG